MLRNFILTVSVFLFLAGCMPAAYYQHEEPVPGNAWQYQFQPTFRFEITDTNSLYNIYFIIRHTDAYPYANIWLLVSIKTPGDTAFKKLRINVPLAERSGRWLGRGMGEIYEQQMLLNTPGDTSICRRAGIYEIKLEQDMRVNPLPEVLHVGLRVEKEGERYNAKKR